MSALSRTGGGPTPRSLRKRLAARRASWGPLGREPWLFALAGSTAVLDAVASIIRYDHFGAGLDLAIFDQAVWHYSRFEAPFSSIKGENLLGDHFHPLVAALAPLYWIWSDPRMLLIAQAVLIAASIVPVFLFAVPRLGRPAALLLAGAYAAFWGVQVGVFYDFHEVAFAPLLIGLAILLADRERWPWFWLVIVLLLGVKEDLSLFVAIFGLYLLTKRELRHGLALIVVGIAWYELATRVFIPDLAHGTHYVYWTYGQLGKNPLGAIWGLIKAPWKVFTIGLAPVAKFHTLAALFAPFLFLTLASPRSLLLALPLLAERFLSTNSNFWFTHYDYSMSIAPVLATGAAAGLGNLSRWLPEARRRQLIIVATSAMLVASVAIAKWGTSDSAVNQLTTSSFYSAPADAAPAARALAQVPAGASLATQDVLLPHASHRREIEQLDPKTVGHDQYVVVNVTDPTCCGVTGNGTYAVFGGVLNEVLPAYTPVFYDKGFLVARRPTAGTPPTNGVLTPMRAPQARTVTSLAVRWKTNVVAAFKRYFPCAHLWAAHAASAAPCFAATNPKLESSERALAGVIADVDQHLSGGCAQLASTALFATRALTLGFVRLAAAAAAPNMTALPAAQLLLSTELNNLNLGGPIDRFTILCSPRA